MAKGVLGDEEVRTHEYRESDEGYGINRKYRIGNTVRNRIHDELEKGLADHIDVSELISSGDDKIHVDVHTGVLEPRTLTAGGHYVFHADEEDPNEAYSVFERHVEEYDLDTFLDEYDLHGSLQLDGRHGRSETLVDTESGELDTNYQGLWREARNAWKQDHIGHDGGEDTEYLADTENLDFLAPLMFEVGANAFEDYDELSRRVTIRVPELDADTRGELVNRSKPGA